MTNANAAYEHARKWRPDREQDLLVAHAMLMKGLTELAGAYRRSNVGVLHGARVAHVAPPPAFLEQRGARRTTEYRFR